MMKVFVSSTFVDLKAYRDKAVAVLPHYKCLPLAMEFFGSLSQDAETVCEKEIRDCDIFIGIYAHRYGYMPEGKKISITQMEYELAKKSGKDCLCFIVDKDFPWKLRFVESEKSQELKDFLDIVKKENVVSFFTDPRDFEIKLSTSLGKLVAEKKVETVSGERKAAPDTSIPCEPTSYIAHPYALPQHFTGREAEMAVLSNWFHNEKEPVLVLEAIGGMGKTALSWVWLRQQVLAPNIEVDGFFWWSFYEGPFESFIAHLWCYVTGNEAKEGIDLAALAAALLQHRFLLVLDGLERVLRGYAGMEAMFIQEKRFQGDIETEADWEKRMREPVHPLAGRFFQALTAAKSRTLVTTRLMPAPLEGLVGVKHLFLKGLSRSDTVRFLRSEGVKGSRAELEEAGSVYDFHPLMLKLLASSIKRSRTKDIEEAFAMDLIHREKPHKILSTAFNLLTKEERQVAIHASVFRGAFSYESIKALVPEMEENQLWVLLQGLRSLGFLFYHDTADRFDFHPIMRAFLYGQLTSAGGTALQVHTLAVEYFQAVPEPEKVVTLEDLAPVIELYHHLVKAGKYDEARELFRDRIVYPTFHQLSTYHLIIELLKPLLPEGDCDSSLPLLKREAAQGWTLNSLANTYSLSGQPAKAVPLFLQCIKLSEKNEDKKNLSVGLANAAYMPQIQIGQLSASTAHLRKSIALCREIRDEFVEGAGHQELGRTLAFQGKIKAEEELDIAFKLFKKGNNVQSLGLASAYRSLSVLLQTRQAAMHRVPAGEENQAGSLGREALAQARRALAFAEKTVKTLYPHSRDFVQSYWLLGETLVQCCVSPGTVKMEPFEIPFYDEYFQQQTDVALVETGNESTAAERCLHEALRRCRKVNLVEFEPDILLGLARLDRAKNRAPDQKLLEEAREISLRAGYRLKLADLHLFCGQVLLETKQSKILGFHAKEHLNKAKEYALDVSEFSHLYQSPNPDFYKDIPEYQMLKKGMTEKERIENGYFVVYQIADILSGR